MSKDVDMPPPQPVVGQPVMATAVAYPPHGQQQYYVPNQQFQPNLQQQQQYQPQYAPGPAPALYTLNNTSHNNGTTNNNNVMVMSTDNKSNVMVMSSTNNKSNVMVSHGPIAPTAAASTLNAALAMSSAAMTMHLPRQR